jgi:hypothetical protein
MRFHVATLVLAAILSANLPPPCTAGERLPLDLKGARVLVCASYFDLMNIPALRRLQKAGAEVRPGDLGALSWDIARKYHLIIVINELPPKKPASGDGPVEALARFVKAGGGVLFFCDFTSAKDDVNRYLAPFDAALRREFLQDPQHTFKCPTGFNLPYAYTENIAGGHPVTEGVKGIWYNADVECLHTSAIDVSHEWQILASGEASATSFSIPGGLLQGSTVNPQDVRPGKFQHAPPILAARQFGSGRIVFTGISPMEAFYGQELPAYGNIAMENGDGLRKSDFGRLYQNALRWLAERVMASNQIGQEKLKPVENSWEKAQVFDWSKDLFGPDLCAKPARGVIGLHSTLSDGKATPEALIARARQSGLQWVAFTEKLEDFAAGPWKHRAIDTGMFPSASERSETLSPDKWEQLRKICREASAPDFAVLPGLDYQDHSGTRWVVFGDFEWPPEKVFSPDKQRIDDPQWWFSINGMPNGPYDIGHAPLRFWDLSLYNFFPVRTALAGKTVDEALEGYRYVHGVQDDPYPMSVAMCYDEAQLVAAAGRMCNFVTQQPPGDLSKLFRERTYYSSWRGFVSDGPVVTDWRAMNASRQSGGRWWASGTEQYRLKLSVRSGAPITDVRIYDGPVLLRRFRPNQTAATLVWDLPHDKQRNLVAEITDAEGRRAITGGLCVLDHLNWRFMCGDRGNSICDGVQFDETGPYMTGPTAPYQRKMTAFPVAAGYGEHHFSILPPEFDGGMRPFAMNVTPSFQSPGYTQAPPGSTLESRMGVPVCSRDGLLQHDQIVGYFPGVASSWEPKLAPKNIEGVKVRYRYLDITARARDPGVLLVEGSLTFARAMKLESLNVLSIFHASQPGRGDHYALATPEANVAGMVAGEPFSASGKMVPGSYGCLFPSPWGAAGLIALDEGYMMDLGVKAPGVHLIVRLADMPRQMRAGETLNYRYVLLRGHTGERPNTADWERFVQTMGFRGWPAYQVNDVKAGQVKSERFLLELVPTDGGFVGTVTPADLPIRLPVRLAAMNPNWTFGWFDLDRKEWYPSAVDRDIRQGFFTLDTRRGKHRLFAGHPVLADDPAVRMAVFSDGKSVVRAALNNVGDAPRSLVVRLNPALGTALPQRLDLSPGELKEVKFLIQM